MSVMLITGAFLHSRSIQAKGAYPAAIGANADRAAHVPYMSTQSTQRCTGLTGCSLQFPAPPTGYRAVIQHISGLFSQYPLSSGTLQPAWFYLYVDAAQVQEAPSFFGESPAGSGVVSIANADALAYIDAGSAITGIAEGNWQLGLPVNVTLSGYLENCSVTGCPAVHN